MNASSNSKGIQPPGQTVIEMGKNITNKISQSNINWKLFLYIILGILAVCGIVYGIIKVIEYGKEKSKVIPSSNNNNAIQKKQLDNTAGRIDKISISRNGSIGATANRVEEAFSDYSKPVIESFVDEKEKTDIVRKEVKDETSLVNYLTLGCRLGGYLGPKMNGVFN